MFLLLRTLAFNRELESLINLKASICRILTSFSQSNLTNLRQVMFVLQGFHWTAGFLRGALVDRSVQSIPSGSTAPESSRVIWGH